MSLLLLLSIDLAISYATIYKQKCDGNICSDNNYTNGKFQSTSIHDQFSVDVVKINDESSNLLQLTLVNQYGEDKHQIYKHIFDLTALSEINKHESIQMNKFINLILYCLSEKNNQHHVVYKIVKLTNAHYVEIHIVYQPDDFTSNTFIFKVPAKQMNEIDLLKLRIAELENNMKMFQSFVPVLFYQTLTKTLGRTKGWNNIVLDHCSGCDNQFIQHDKENGYIKLLRGTYSVQAEATVVYVNGNVIQIKSVANNKISLYSTPQYSRHGQHSWTSTSAIIPRQTIVVEDESINLMFRMHVQTSYSNAVYFEANKGHKPKQYTKGHAASVTVQRLLL